MNHPYLNDSQIRNIIQSLREKGLDVGLRDVAYAILASVLGQDRNLGHKAIFGVNPDVPFEDYDKQEKVLKVQELVCEALYGDLKAESKQPADGLVSFDDLKEGLIRDMRSLEDMRDMKDKDGRPALEPKEMAQVVGRIADIRVKLSEKFGTTERVVEQRVVVEQKYSDVCPYCGHEIAIRPK